MQPVTFVVSLCKLYAVGLILCSKIADNHGIEVHDVLTWKFVYFQKIFRFLLHNTRDVTRGQGGTISRAPNHYGGGKKSQQCYNHFFQNSRPTSASERPQVRTWGRQTCFFPQTPSNIVTLLHITIVQSKWRNLFAKIPAHQWQTINHKLFKTKCCWLSKSSDHRKQLEGRKKGMLFRK